MRFPSLLTCAYVTAFDGSAETFTVPPTRRLLNLHPSNQDECSESNVSYFILSVHDIRGECRWYGSRGCTVPSTFHYKLLLCDRQQQRGGLTQWCLTWKHAWSKGVALNSSMQKKWHPLTFIDACWAPMPSEQQWVIETVGHLHWCRFLWARHGGSCSSLTKMHS